MVEMHLNNQIKVKLTEKGKDIIIEKYQKSTNYSHAEIKEYIEDKIDSEGFFTTELWNLANIFGRYMFNGTMDEVLEGNKVYFEEKELFKNTKSLDEISTIIK